MTVTFMDNTEPVVIARTWMNSEASVIKSLLESYDIPCHYMAELPHRIYPLSGNGVAEIRIYVPAFLAENARRVLADHRRSDASLRLVEVEDEQG
jgi:hypothetical protein